jgi:hypothetical protein
MKLLTLFSLSVFVISTSCANRKAVKRFLELEAQKQQRQEDRIINNPLNHMYDDLDPTKDYYLMVYKDDTIIEVPDTVMWQFPQVDSLRKIKDFNPCFSEYQKEHFEFPAQHLIDGFGLYISFGEETSNNNFFGLARLRIDEYHYAYLIHEAKEVVDDTIVAGKYYLLIMDNLNLVTHIEYGVEFINDYGPEDKRVFYHRRGNGNAHFVDGELHIFSQMRETKERLSKDLSYRDYSKHWKLVFDKENYKYELVEVKE